jgi:hypothetical protein
MEIDHPEYPVKMKAPVAFSTGAFFFRYWNPGVQLKWVDYPSEGAIHKKFKVNHPFVLLFCPNKYVKIINVTHHI